MNPGQVFPPALKALDDCEEALRDLDAACCDPGRSPQMQMLGETLSQVRNGISAPGDDARAAQVERLEAARTQVRRLQAGCCEPNRLPMYRLLLEGLSTVRMVVDGQGGAPS